MSRFYGTVNGAAKTVATRQGNKSTGLETRCYGWDVGIFCAMRADGEDRDTIEVYMTGGSNGSGGDIHLGTARLESDGSRSFTPDFSAINAGKDAVSAGK